MDWRKQVQTAYLPKTRASLKKKKRFQPGTQGKHLLVSGLRVCGGQVRHAENRPVLTKVRNSFRTVDIDRHQFFTTKIDPDLPVSRIGFEDVTQLGPLKFSLGPNPWVSPRLRPAGLRRSRFWGESRPRLRLFGHAGELGLDLRPENERLVGPGSSSSKTPPKMGLSCF